MSINHFTAGILDFFYHFYQQSMLAKWSYVRGDMLLRPHIDKIVLVILVNGTISKYRFKNYKRFVKIYRSSNAKCLLRKASAVLPL